MVAPLAADCRGRGLLSKKRPATAATLIELSTFALMTTLNHSKNLGAFSISRK